MSSQTAEIASALDERASTVVAERPAFPRWQVVAIFCVAFAACAVYAYSHLKTGWIPSDDGALAQSAYRVLNGQLPHRDFTEIYTGALSYLHAAGFKLFGVDLVALRLTLFIFFLAWLPAVFFIAYRLVSPFAAAGIVMLAAVWTIPSYPAAMPSWYNLFLATFGIAALFRYLEAGTRRWLFIAGLCGGLSFLIKIIGLYYVAGVLLFLLFREQCLSANQVERPRRSSLLYRLFMTAGLAAFLAVLAWMMLRRLDGRELLHFLLPAAALVAVLIFRERRIDAAASAARFTTFFRIAAPFLVGFLVPVILFLLPYYRSGSLGAFWNGVFSRAYTSAQHMGIARPFPIEFLLCALPVLALLAMATYGKGSPLSAQALVALFLGASLWFVVKLPVLTLAAFTGAQQLTPVVVLFGAGILALRPEFADRLPETRQQQIMLVLAITALCSVVQFPFAAPIYFNYCAPLTALTLAAVISTRQKLGSPYVLAALVAFYIGFAVFRIVPSEIYYTSFQPLPGADEPLRLPRSGGLKVQRASMYEETVKTIQQHSPNGLLIATPECPELYFLSGLRNPGRSDNGIPFSAAIHNGSVNVVVINESPYFGARMSAAETAELSARFPHSTRIGKYWICWRR